MPVHPTPTILLTRPRAAAERIARDLPGAEVVIAPLMDIVGTGAEFDLGGVSGIILTSANAVEFLPGAGLPAYCVGPRTAAAASEAGFKAEVLGGDADGLVDALITRPVVGPLLHPHGVHVRGDVAERLSAAGIETKGVAVYDQRALPAPAELLTALTRPNLRIPLFSARSAKLFAAATPNLPEDARIIALSEAVARALPQDWQSQIKVLSAPDPDEMLSTLQGEGMRRNSP